MKKLHSMLAILLILTCLLSVLVSCAEDPAPVEEEEETTAPTDNSSDGNKTYPLTEKDKENIYKNAMLYLSNDKADLAYDEFLKIPDYKNVAEYLARFSYGVTTIYEYEYATKVDHVNSFSHYYTKYGQPSKFQQRGEKSKDTQYVYDESSRFLTMLTDSPYVHHYTYDEATGLLVSSTTQHGVELTTTTYAYADSANPTRLTSTTGVVTSSASPDKAIRTIILEYTYNARGDVTKETETTVTPNADPTLDPNVVVKESLYTYNADGTLAKFESTDVLGKYFITYEYENGLLMKETLTHEAEAPEMTAENYSTFLNFVYSQTTTYVYDHRDRIDSKQVIANIFIDETYASVANEVLTYKERVRDYDYTKYNIYYNPYA